MSPATICYHGKNRPQNRLPEPYGNGVAYLSGGAHQPPGENEVIGKSLQACGLTHRYAMMLRWVQKSPLGRIDAGRGHGGRGFRGIDASVYVLVPVMIFVTRENPAGILSAAPVGRRGAKNLQQRLSMVHMDVVGITLRRRMEKRFRSGMPRRQAGNRRGRVAMGGRGRPRRVARHFILPPENKDAFSALRNTVIARIKYDGRTNVVASRRGFRIKFFKMVLVPRPQQTDDVLHKKRRGTQSANEIEITYQQLIAGILDAGILKAQSRKALTRRPSHQDVRHGSLRKNRQHFFRRNIADVPL